MIFHSRFCSILSLMILALSAQSLPADFLFNGVPQTGLGSNAFIDANTTIGVRFTVKDQPVVVTRLGVFDSLFSTNQQGLFEPHNVGIWNSSTGALLASVVVPAGTAVPLESSFRYVPLSTSVLLNPNTSYTVGALYVTSWQDNSQADLFRFLSGNAAINNILSSNVTFNQGIFGPLGGGFSMPLDDGYGYDEAYLSANIEMVAVPEPTTWALAMAVIAVIIAVRYYFRKSKENELDQLVTVID